MALVKCPECGKEKVSDTALACPECGYAIKNHFKQLEADRQRLLKIQSIEKEKKEREEQDLQKKKEYENRLQNDPDFAEQVRQKELEEAQNKLKEAQAYKENLIKQLEEKRESEIKSKTKGVIWSIVWTIICMWSVGASKDGSLGWFIVIALFFAAGGWIMLFLSKGSVEQMSRDIEIASKSVEEYQQIVERRREYAKAQVEKNRAIQAAKHPKCPNCGSTNTERISTASRTVSVATVGLASGKIGKQYRCKNCKHMW